MSVYLWFGYGTEVRLPRYDKILVLTLQTKITPHEYDLISCTYLSRELEAKEASPHVLT